MLQNFLNFLNFNFKIFANFTECCSANGVSPYCASKMCDVRTIPNALETIAISTSCRTEWSKVFTFKLSLSLYQTYRYHSERLRSLADSLSFFFFSLED